MIYLNDEKINYSFSKVLDSYITSARGEYQKKLYPFIIQHWVWLLKLI